MEIHAPSLVKGFKRGDLSPLPTAITLLRESRKEGDLRRSIRNCHTPGVDSIVLFEEEQCGGMIRFYWARHDSHALHELYDADGHFTVGVHNHRYPIVKIPLNEMVVNVVTDVSEEATDHVLWEYDFSSELVEGNLRAGDGRQQYMHEIVEQRLYPGDHIVMAASDLHTMIVPKQEHVEASAWIVIEGAHVDIDPLIYSPLPTLQISKEGLYEQMSVTDARSILDRALELTKNAALQYR